MNVLGKCLYLFLRHLYIITLNEPVNGRNGVALAENLRSEILHATFTNEKLAANLIEWYGIEVMW